MYVSYVGVVTEGTECADGEADREDICNIFKTIGGGVRNPWM